MSAAGLQGVDRRVSLWKDPAHISPTIPCCDVCEVVDGEPSLIRPQLGGVLLTSLLQIRPTTVAFFVICHQTSNIRDTLVGSKIGDHLDVVGALFSSIFLKSFHWIHSKLDL